jgi:hypothetical protein
MPARRWRSSPAFPTRAVTCASTRLVRGFRGSPPADAAALADLQRLARLGSRPLKSW